MSELPSKKCVLEIVPPPVTGGSWSLRMPRIDGGHHDLLYSECPIEIAGSAHESQPAASKELAQDLVDFVTDFDGMVPGDHLLRMAERLGLPRDSEAWDIVRKRLTDEPRLGFQPLVIEQMKAWLREEHAEAIASGLEWTNYGHAHGYIEHLERVLSAAIDNVSELQEISGRAALPPPAVPSEKAWLIELSFDGKAMWWYGSDFIADTKEAVRFFRKEDAEQVILERSLFDAVATEHIWINDMPALTAQANAVSSIDYWQQRGHTDARFHCGDNVLFNGTVESVVVEVRERQYVIGLGTVAWEHELTYSRSTKEVKP